LKSNKKKPVFESKKPVFESKNLFMGQKFWKKFGKCSETLEIGLSKCSEFTEISEIVLFQKLQKNDVKLELQKSRKTCSYLKTDSKVWFKV